MSSPTRATPNDASGDPDAREWCVREHLDALHDESGRPGRRRERMSDLASLYTYEKGW